MYLTYNIENTEKNLEIPKEKIIYLSGSASNLTKSSPSPMCSKCGASGEDNQKFQEQLQNGKIMLCEN